MYQYLLSDQKPNGRLDTDIPPRLPSTCLLFSGTPRPRRCTGGKREPVANQRLPASRNTSTGGTTHSKPSAENSSSKNRASAERKPDIPLHEPSHISPIHLDRCPGDIASPLGSQERHQRCQFLRFAHALHGKASRDGF